MTDSKLEELIKRAWSILIESAIPLTMAPIAFEKVLEVLISQEQQGSQGLEWEERKTLLPDIPLGTVKIDN